MKKKKTEKIQNPEMERDIERCRDVAEAWLQGGKAIGEITKNRLKKKP